MVLLTIFFKKEQPLIKLVQKDFLHLSFHKEYKYRLNALKKKKIKKYIKIRPILIKVPIRPINVKINKIKSQITSTCCLFGSIKNVLT